MGRVIVYLLCLFNFPIFLFARPSLQNLEDAWGLFSTNPHLRHRFEGITWSDSSVSQKHLIMRVWNPTSSVTMEEKDEHKEDHERNLTCRIAHILVFGRHQLRTKNPLPPISYAFQELSELEDVTLIFYDTSLHAVASTNSSPTPTSTEPRVVWSRKEDVQPYLSYVITRSEWRSLQPTLNSLKTQNFEKFRDGICVTILQIAPNVKALQQSTDRRDGRKNGDGGK